MLALTAFEDCSEVGTALPGRGVAALTCSHVIGASVIGACGRSGEAVEVDGSPSARCAGDRVSAQVPLGPDTDCGVGAVDVDAGSAAPGEVGESWTSTGSLGPGGFAHALARCSGYMAISIHTVRK